MSLQTFFTNFFCELWPAATRAVMMLGRAIAVAFALALLVTWLSARSSATSWPKQDHVSSLTDGGDLVPPPAYTWQTSLPAKASQSRSLDSKAGCVCRPDQP